MGGDQAQALAVGQVRKGLDITHWVPMPTSSQSVASRMPILKGAYALVPAPSAPAKPIPLHYTYILPSSPLSSWRPLLAAWW